MTQPLSIDRRIICAQVMSFVLPNCEYRSPSRPTVAIPHPLGTYRPSMKRTEYE